MLWDKVPFYRLDLELEFELESLIAFSEACNIESDANHSRRFPGSIKIP